MSAIVDTLLAAAVFLAGMVARAWLQAEVERQAFLRA
jgi:hypothetical protein